MTQLLKAALVSLVIALSLTSDTALSASQVQGSWTSQATKSSARFKVQESAKRSSTYSVAFATTTPRPLYWDGRNWMFQPATLPCASTPK